MPVYLKSIKPSSTLGGLAGGEKYTSYGILFMDVEAHSGLWIYGKTKRNDYLASKALSNDIKALDALYQFKKPNLS